MKIKLKIRSKLVFSFLLVAIISAFIGYTGFYIMQEVLKQMKITKNAVNTMYSVSNAEKHAFLYKINLNKLDYKKSLSFVDSAIRFTQANREMYDWEENIALANKNITAANIFKESFRKYDENIDKANIKQVDLEKYWNTCEDQINIMLNHSNEMTTGVIKVINYAVSTGIKIIVLGILITFALIIILTFILTNNIHKQLGGEPDEIAELAEKIAEGNLNYEIENKGRNYGIYASMIIMKNKLEKIVEQIYTTAESVFNASEKISNNSNIVSEEAKKQFHLIQEVSNSLNTMNNAILESSKNAIESENIANETATKVSIDYAEAQKALESLSNLGNKLEIINEIAQQTNLLSLNASVEAARAGEHGRGFAIVAKEIGNLANQSGSAAEDFSKESDRIAKTTVKQLSSIVPDIEKIVKYIKEIASSTSMQKEEADAVKQAFLNLKSVAENNNLSANQMNENAEYLKKQAEALEEAMQYFNINN